LGGVCSGLAWYLNMDPTVVRLATVLLTILSVSTMGLAYLILWIVVPEARTPLERMQMMGEQPTMENIARTVTGSFKDNPSGMETEYPSRSFGDNLASFFGVCAKVLVIFGLIIGILILVGLILGLLGCLFALIMFTTGMGSTFFGDASSDWVSDFGPIPVWGVLCGIGCILSVGIPLFLLVRMGLKKNSAPLSRSIRNSLLIIWVLSFLLAGFSTGRIVSLANEIDRDEMEARFDRCIDDMSDFEDEVAISIDNDSTSTADSVNNKKEIISITREGIYISTDSVKMNIGKKPR
ncbi:MAG: PspC domain-containing protein, partial [Muribaculaceae bacterium]|nr:PspC domain-containing protein [Muribaculaceae bacterium]